MEYFTVTLETSLKPYLKVHFLNEEDIEPTKAMLEKLQAVDHVNITFNQAQTRSSLIIYISQVYKPEEAKQEVEAALNSYLNSKPIFQEKKAKDLESFLAKYPNVLKQYKSAKEKYERGVYERNVLDDMRLALELLVKNVLKTEANTLNLQKTELGTFLKEHSCDTTIRNMFMAIYDYYMKYQNDHVKHNDKIVRKDINTVLSLTIVLMERLKDEVNES